MARMPTMFRYLFSFKSLLRLFLAGMIFVAVGLLSMPYWTGWALKSFLPEDIANFESYSRVGYGRFKLTKTIITHPQATVTIDQLEALSPLNWLRFAMTGKSTEPFMSVGEVIVTLEEESVPSNQEEKPASDLPKNLPEALTFLENILLKADRWLPHTAIEKLTLIRGEEEVELSELNWRNRKLTLTGELSRYSDHPFELSLNLKSGSSNLELAIPSADFDLKSSLQEKANQLIASTILVFRENTALIESTFGQGNWSPETASWNLADWDLNLNTLGLNSTYSHLRFNLEGGWDEGSISNRLDGNLSTEAQRAGPTLPPVAFESEIEGNSQALSLSRFTLDAPGVNARMNDPVEYNLQQMQLAGSLRFDINFDLGILHFEELQGRLTGLLEVSTTGGKPVGQFNLQGEGIKIRSMDFETVDIRAELDWPTLRMHNLTTRLSTDTSLEGQALIDLESRLIDEASLTGVLNRKTVKPWLPEDVAWENLTFTTELSGPFQSIQHRGSLDIQTLETGPIKPLSATASWEGQAFQVESLTLNLANEESSLVMKANGNLSPSLMDWQINQLEVKSQNRELALFKSPAKLRINREAGLEIRIEDLDLKGDAERLTLDTHLAYPRSGQVNIKAKNIVSSDWLNPWLKQGPPGFTLNALVSQASWNEGPVEFDTTLDAIFNLNGQAVQAIGTFSSNGQAIRLENIEVQDSKGPWVTMNGILPITLSQVDVTKIQLNKDEPLQLNLDTSNSPNWVAWLSKISPFELTTFKSHASLEGTLSNLKGDFEIDLETKADSGDHGLPSMRLEATGEINQSLLELSSVKIGVLDDTFEAKGSLSFPEELIDKIETPSIHIPWEKTKFSLEIPSSSLTSIQYFIPQLLNREGRIEADLQGSIDEGIRGFLSIDGLSTRAIFPFGSLRDFTANLKFENSQATLENVSGFIGREPATIIGSLDYTNWKDPSYNFSIQGQDLPLLRKPGVLLRSDLDLKIDNRSTELTEVSGSVQLKDGLYLLNKNTLLSGGAGGGRSAESRPPFFAVDVPYLADWTLNIDVKGDEFIRVRTPAADGVLSLDMKLQGKLKEPFATGRITFDQGNLFFPFSSFKIDYGNVELPIDNPYIPFIDILGSSRRFGYDLGVEISGSAYDPKVQFTSNPPLSSEQIMLMVMAGENPEGMFDYSTTQRASKLGSYISKGLFASGDSGGSLLNRLSVNSGENLSEQGKETMEIELMLNERFQLIGEYDEYDFWNAGLRWRIFQRHLRETEPEAPE